MSRIILYATVPLPSIALHSSQNFAIKALSMLPLTFCIPFTLSYLSLITAKEELNASAAVIDTADPNLAVLEAMQAELKSMELKDDGEAPGGVGNVARVKASQAELI